MIIEIKIVILARNRTDSKSKPWTVTKTIFLPAVLGCARRQTAPTGGADTYITVLRPVKPVMARVGDRHVQSSPIKSQAGYKPLFRLLLQVFVMT